MWSEELVRSVSSAQATNMGTTIASATRTIRARPNRRRLNRWLEMGAGRSGSRSRNSACTSRPWARIMWRSWDGMASPRVAANASVISSTENCRWARS